jgi:hypothetical protein
MGIKQFSGSLSDFNQNQLDTINTAVGTINTAVTALKNTDMAQLSQKIEGYRQGQRYVKTSTMNYPSGGMNGAAGTVTILSVTGKGTLRGLVMRSDVNGSTLKLTIDGAVVANWMMNTNGNLVGMFPIQMSNGAGNSYIAGMASPDWGEGSAMIRPMLSPMYFNTSLLIEYTSSQAYTGLGFIYDVGVMS